MEYNGKYNENILLALLEYGNIPYDSLWSKIALSLGMYYYKEESVHTLCTNTFVIDIKECKCTLQFVDDELNKRFGYIQKYLNEYFHRKDLFYLVLRYFGTVEGSFELPGEIKKGRGYRSKRMCSCVFSGDYCEKRGVLKDGEEGYDIFLHGKGCLIEEPLIHFRINEYAQSNEYSDNNAQMDKIDENLSTYFYKEEYFLKTELSLKNNRFLKHKADLFEFREDNVLVRNGDVFVDGEKSKIASFLFRNGLSLENSLLFLNKFSTL